MCASEHLSEHVAVRGLEAQSLPERSGTAAEEPRAVRPAGCTAVESEAGQPETPASTATVRIHGDAAHEGVLAVPGELVAREGTQHAVAAACRSPPAVRTPALSNASAAGVDRPS